MDWNFDPRTAYLAEETRTRNLQASLAAQRARDEAAKAAKAKQDAERAKTASGLNANARANDARTIEVLKKEAAEKDQKMEAIATALKSQQELVLEWMHNSEAFKKLARDMGKKLGMTDEERQAALMEAVVDVAEEDPLFQNTELGKKAKKAIGNKA